MKRHFQNSMEKNKIYLPRKPKGATHLLFTTQHGGRARKAIVSIQDVDALVGSQGQIQFVKKIKDKILDQYDPVYTWDGKGVEGFTSQNAEEGQKTKEKKKD